jgi:hypothetical protein
MPSPSDPPAGSLYTQAAETLRVEVVGMTPYESSSRDPQRGASAPDGRG